MTVYKKGEQPKDYEYGLVIAELTREIERLKRIINDLIVETNED
jgi:hypothetical protein